MGNEGGTHDANELGFGNAKQSRPTHHSGCAVLITTREKGALAGGALGAGMGAIIGNQVGHQGSGALIGGALGGGLIGVQMYG